MEQQTRSTENSQLLFFGNFFMVLAIAPHWLVYPYHEAFWRVSPLLSLQNKIILIFFFRVMVLICARRAGWGCELHRERRTFLCSPRSERIPRRYARHRRQGYAFWWKPGCVFKSSFFFQSIFFVCWHCSRNHIV